MIRNNTSKRKKELPFDEDEEEEVVAEGRRQHKFKLRIWSF